MVGSVTDSFRLASHTKTCTCAASRASDQTPIEAVFGSEKLAKTCIQAVDRCEDHSWSCQTKKFKRLGTINPFDNCKAKAKTDLLKDTVQNAS